MQKILDTHDSYSDVMRYFGLDPRNGSIKTLYTRIKDENLDTSHLDKKRWAQRNINRRKTPNDKIFVENSNFSRNGVKKRITSENLIPYKCENCGNTGDWNGKALTLQLEHKNGINNDNRLENLGFLCPNCHSQTKTYAGKQTVKPHYCTECGVEISHQAKKCRPCANKDIILTEKADWPSDKALAKLVWAKPSTIIAKELGVSDTAIKKRCRARGIPKPPRGYWTQRKL